MIIESLHGATVRAGEPERIHVGVWDADKNGSQFDGSMGRLIGGVDLGMYLWR